jgi:gamma-glutamyltranspeptidase / glutathione hydrolase
MKNVTIVLVSLFAFSCTDHGVRLVPRPAKFQHESKTKKFMITTQGSHTSKIAAKVIKEGGNIIDAAIAASFAIGVERPQSTGIGGGGFLIYYEAKTLQTHVYDFRERAPLKSHSKMYLDKKGNVIKGASLNGALSVGVPGLVAGLSNLHSRYASMDWKRLVSPAASLAREGFSVYPHLEKAIKRRAQVLTKFPESKSIFFKNGKGLLAGEQLIQKNLANSLSLIAKDPQDFYAGSIGKKIIKSIKRHGGIMTLEDLKTYKVKKLQPIEVDFKGYKVVSMPPPSSGGTHIAQILQVMEQLNWSRLEFGSAKHIHYLASSMQLAFADRATYMGDSDFVEVPVKKLTSKSYAKKLFKFIPENRALAPTEILSPLKAFLEGNDTTHFSMMDALGNVVVSTQTVNYLFGSGLVAEGTGIVLNDEMDDFSTKPGVQNVYGAVGSAMNLVEPQKTPLSSMSPTIVFKDGKPILALGTPNGTRILTCVAQTILNYIGFKLPLYESVAALRIHHQWYPDKLSVGTPGLDKHVFEELKSMGHKIENKEFSCSIQAIGREGDYLHGVSDPRGEGLAVGL